MKKYLLVILICLLNNKALSIESYNTIGKYDWYFSGKQYTSPFPYEIEMKCNKIKYIWNGSSIIVHATKHSKEEDYQKLIDNIPIIVYDFKKNFFKNSENYFKYLIDNEVNNNICNNIIECNLNSFKNYGKNKCIIEKYNNPFDKNPFTFTIDNEIFRWKDSKIFMNNYNSKYKNTLNNILINFNDSFQYFKYLIQKIIPINSSKIKLEHNARLNNNYKSLTLDVKINNPFNNIIVIRDSIRMCKWNKNTMDIAFPDWLNDNLSKNNHSTFIKLLENANNNFSKYKYNKLEDFTEFIENEFGSNVLIYALNMNNFDWEVIENTNNPWISTVMNYSTGFEEVEYKEKKNSYEDKDGDDF